MLPRLLALSFLFGVCLSGCDFFSPYGWGNGATIPSGFQIAVVARYPDGTSRIALGDFSDPASFQIVSGDYKYCAYPTFSPSGKYLAFIDLSGRELGRSPILVRELRKGRFFRLPSNQDGPGVAGADFAPVLWPAADTLVYSWSLGLSAGGRVVTYVWSEGSENPLAPGLRPWFSLDARSVVVRQYRGNLPERYLSFSLVTNDTTFISNAAIQPSLSMTDPTPLDWSAKERSFLFSARAASSTVGIGLWLSSQDGGVIQMLTDGLQSDHEAIFGPDDSIVFVREDIVGAGRLVYLDRQTGEMTRLLEPGALNGANDFANPASDAVTY